MVPRSRNRSVGIAIVLAALGTIGILIVGARRYRVALPDASNSTPALLLTALNGDGGQSSSSLRLLEARGVPTVSIVKAAARLNFGPRAPAAFEAFEDPELLSTIGHKASPEDPTYMLSYAQASQGFLQARTTFTAANLADRMIDLDPDAAARDLPGLMTRSGRRVLPWLRLDADPGFAFADAYVRQERHGPASPETLYLVLSWHPSVRRRGDIDGIFGRARVVIPPLSARTTTKIERNLRPRKPRPTRMLAPLARGAKTIDQLRSEASSSHFQVRQDAEEELADRAPMVLAPLLSQKLRTGRAPEVVRAVELRTQDRAALLALVFSKDGFVRASVASRLRELAGRETRGALDRLRKDPSRAVRFSAGGR